VLANLLGNAVKFTERGEVVLIVEESAAREHVRFSIVDSGIGIPEGVGARLMRPFEQGDPSTTRRFGGSGLGLAICLELVGLMGGNISFTSIPGRCLGPTLGPRGHRRIGNGLGRHDRLEELRGSRRRPTPRGRHVRPGH